MGKIRALNTYTTALRDYRDRDNVVNASLKSRSARYRRQSIQVHFVAKYRMKIFILVQKRCEHSNWSLSFVCRNSIVVFSSRFYRISIEFCLISTRSRLRGKRKRETVLDTSLILIITLSGHYVRGVPKNWFIHNALASVLTERRFKDNTF